MDITHVIRKHCLTALAYIATSYFHVNAHNDKVLPSWSSCCTETSWEVTLTDNNKSCSFHCSATLIQDIFLQYRELLARLPISREHKYIVKLKVQPRT